MIALSSPSRSEAGRHHVHVAAVGRDPAPALGITAESRVCRRFAARLEKTTIPEITALAVIRQVHNDSGDLVVEAKIFVGTRIACVVANSRTGGSREGPTQDTGLDSEGSVMRSRQPADAD